jgi:mediator of RNA polymerase II transcription subunit 12
LYLKIFPAIGGNKGSVDPASVEQVGQFAKQDEPFVRLLCQWAVSDQRYGEHRAIAAALLLEKRQMDLVALTENDAAGADDNDTDENLAAVSAIQPVYQVIFFVFILKNYFICNVDSSGIFNEIS